MVPLDTVFFGISSICGEKISIYRIVSESLPEAYSKKEYLGGLHPLKKVEGLHPNIFKLRNRILNSPSCSFLENVTFPPKFQLLVCLIG